MLIHFLTKRAVGKKFITVNGKWRVAGMAYAVIDFEHPVSGAMRTAPVGFSWTTLFFGPIPALLRGHWVGALVIFILYVVTFGLSGLVFPFIYNKMYIKYLIGEGYKVKSSSQDSGHLSRRLQINLPALA
jgi:hypothetical protein